METKMNVSVSEKEKRRWRKLHPKNWEGPPPDLNLEELLRLDGSFRSGSISDISAAAEIVENDEQVAPTADKYSAICEAVNRYRDSLTRWLSDIASSSDSATPMGNLPRSEKLAIFQALLSVTGDCADEIIDEEKKQKADQGRRTAGA
jgi:hypothetical protein